MLPAPECPEEPDPDQGGQDERDAQLELAQGRGRPGRYGLQDLLQKLQPRGEIYPEHRNIPRDLDQYGEPHPGTAYRMKVYCENGV